MDKTASQPVNTSSERIEALTRATRRSVIELNAATRMLKEYQQDLPPLNIQRSDFPPYRRQFKPVLV